MKVLVAVKRALDYNLRPRIKADHSGVDLTNLKMSINPFDEIAVEEAVRLKEAGRVAEVVVVSVGPSGVQETLRSALALGADRAIHVDTEEEVLPLSVAKILKNIVFKENPTIILLGKQAIDDDCNQTGQMLAGLLGWSQGTFISKIELQDSKLHITREVDGGLETIACSLPVVLTTDLRLNEPRYPSLPNMMKAKQKSLEKVTPGELGVAITQTQKVISVTEPASRSAGRKVFSVQELVHCLQNEAQVL